MVGELKEIYYMRRETRLVLAGCLYVLKNIFKKIDILLSAYE